MVAVVSRKRFLIRFLTTWLIKCFVVCSIQHKREMEREGESSTCFRSWVLTMRSVVAYRQCYDAALCWLAGYIISSNGDTRRAVGWVFVDKREKEKSPDCGSRNCCKERILLTRSFPHRTKRSTDRSKCLWWRKSNMTEGAPPLPYTTIHHQSHCVI